MGEHDAEIGRDLDDAFAALDRACVALERLGARIGDGRGCSGTAAALHFAEEAKRQVRAVTKQLQPHREGGA